MGQPQSRSPNNNDIPFRLHHLPLKAALEVLENYDTVDLISFSLCSKKSKRLAIMLNWSVDCLKILVDDTFRLAFYHYDVTLNLYNAIFDGRGDQRKFFNRNYEVGDWIRHIASVINNSRIDVLYISSDFFPAEIIKTTLKGLEFDVLVILHGQQSQNRMETLEKLLPQARLVSHGNTFGESNKFLLQNLESLWVPSSQYLKFDDLLMTNFSSLRLYSVTFTGKQLNRFIKLWRKGSNPLLKCVYFSHDWDVDWSADTVLGGIKNEKMAPEETIPNWRIGFWGERFWDGKCQGGYHVHRFDRTKATILLSTNDNRPVFEMIIG